MRSVKKRAPRVWVVSRAKRNALGEIVFVPVGKWRAWTKDDAVRKAAHAIRKLALLRVDRA